MPIQCPPGVPQSACDAANGLLQAQGVQPQGWDAGNVAQTLQQWYASIAKSSPTMPQALPGNAADYVLPPYSTLITSALSYWNGVAYRNPGIAGQINPQAWSFPWQYASPQATSWNQIAVSALGNMLGDPVALQSLLKGKLPPFDPTKINWASFGASPIASNPSSFTDSANTMGQLTPAYEAFLAKANSCGLLQKTTQEIQQALSDFLSFGVDPCARTQPTPTPTPLPPLPVPTPSPAPTPTPAPVAKEDSSSTGLIVLGAVAAGAVGVLAYLLAKRGSPSMAMEGFVQDAHQHLSWQGWNINVEPHGRRWKAFAMHPMTTTKFQVSSNSSYDALQKIKQKISHHYSK